ncbi:MAG: DUF2500 family protein [Clostridia bacterium]|nr:DUF2500 family protein [Clostridia bacterium]
MYEKLGKVCGALIFVDLILLFVARFSGDTWALVLLILLGIATGLLILLLDFIRRKENEKNPITTVTASVVGHRKETYRGRYSSSDTYFVSFKPEDGSPVLEFEVEETEYEDFKPGDTASLRYRTWEFLSFGAKDMSGIEPLSPLPDEDVPSPDTEDDIALDWSGVETRVKALWARVQAAYDQVKARFAARKAAMPKESPASQGDDGVLTHELDEKH